MIRSTENSEEGIFRRVENEKIRLREEMNGDDLKILYGELRSLGAPTPVLMSMGGILMHKFGVSELWSMRAVGARRGHGPYTKSQYKTISSVQKSAFVGCRGQKCNYY